MIVGKRSPISATAEHLFLCFVSSVSVVSGAIRLLDPDQDSQWIRTQSHCAQSHNRHGPKRAQKLFTVKVHWNFVHWSLFSVN